MMNKRDDKGQVVRVTEWRTGRMEPNVLGAPCWGVVTVTEQIRPSFYVEWVHGDPPLYGNNVGTEIADFDEYDVMPPDKWPDEVCTAMAKRALLGEANDQN